jgi:adenine deaminase
MSVSVIRGNRVDALNRSMQPVEIHVQDGSIQSIIQLDGSAPDLSLPFLLPGFIDAHVHIESSMLIPSAFAALAVNHGTVATVSDPHEIANVNGIEGVRFMIENGKQVPFKFYFGAPSCVPATVFETAGDLLDPHQVKSLLEMDVVKYLSEMMNFPGAIAGDIEVMDKIKAAHQLGKPVDGHAPGLRGEALKAYINRGISTDHECFTLEEALEKISLGMKIIIREGSAAKNFEALHPLIDQFPESVMFCSDDKHPDSLVAGHINKLCARAVDLGYDVFHVIRAACINPVLHYKLDVGLLRTGDPADMIMVDNLHEFNVLATFINGEKVSEKGISLIDTSAIQVDPINKFGISEIHTSGLTMSASGAYPLPVIGCNDGQLITDKLSLKPKVSDGHWISDTNNDVLKIVVVNRYHQAPIAKAFVYGFGLKEGAIASSVAHDSHNIVAVGVDDESLCKAINLVVSARGGVSCVGSGKELILPLPIAGLMSSDDGRAVAAAYTSIDLTAKSMGSTLSAPFMSLSFMALLVIPNIKLSDKGLFDGERFAFYQPLQN